MITVHHLVASRSHRVLWLLEELGLPYELRVYPRDAKTRLAPKELREVHPLGKSPVLTDGELVLAESGAILEYLAETYGAQAPAGLRLLPPAGSPEHRQLRFWMHYAEGSLMNWLVMKLVFMTIPRQPMPFFVRPVARKLCATVESKLVDPNLKTAMDFIEAHLAKSSWFAGDTPSLADFQMSFAIAALLSRGDAARHCPRLAAWLQRVEARPAWQRALAKGGPLLMTA